MNDGVAEGYELLGMLVDGTLDDGVLDVGENVGFVDGCEDGCDDGLLVGCEVGLNDLVGAEVDGATEG